MAIEDIVIEGFGCAISILPVELALLFHFIDDY
jgi:hypothetical protein